jgi:hypothetical protein
MFEKCIVNMCFIHTVQVMNPLLPILCIKTSKILYVLIFSLFGTCYNMVFNSNTNSISTALQHNTSQYVKTESTVVMTGSNFIFSRNYLLVWSTQDRHSRPLTTVALYGHDRNWLDVLHELSHWKTHWNTSIQLVHTFITIILSFRKFSK